MKVIAFLAEPRWSIMDTVSIGSFVYFVNRGHLVLGFVSAAVFGITTAVFDRKVSQNKKD